jgi:hypothetical protein
VKAIVLVGHNWPGPNPSRSAHVLAAHCLEQRSSGRWRLAGGSMWIPASQRRNRVGEAILEHDGKGCTPFLGSDGEVAH